MTELAFEPQVWTVSGVTRLIQNTLAAEPLLQSIMVRGEISNYKKYPSGHSYFTLKDDSASLRCVLFRGHSHNVPFEPANGQEVMAMGRVGVYPASGQYQLYVEYMLPQGEGALHYAFTQLKEKLAAEGLFQRKRPLPSMPSRVGIITSRQGAVLRDIISVARRRNPRVDLVLCPAVVQGPEAPASLIEALELCNRYGELDVLIIGRGGGSLEELWAFNDEGVARAIFDSRIPVVSAVGHETDVTIADYVADLRAPTPSAAAELVIPDYEQWKGQLQAYQERLTNYMVRRISEARQAVAALGDRPVLARPLEGIDGYRQVLDEFLGRLTMAWEVRQQNRRHGVGLLTGKLDALSPLKVLARGYSITRRPGGAILRSVEEIEAGEQLEVLLVDGSLATEVLKVEKGE